MGLMGVLNKVPAYVERVPGGSVVMAPADWIIDNIQASSVWYMLFGLACCAIELMATGASRYDFDRLGMIYRASPRQSDVMLVAGTVSLKMAPRIKMLYEQMAEPRFVVAMGGCATNGGPFYYDSYSVLKGIDKILPVDVYIAGCPPRPEALLNGCLAIQKKIRSYKLGQPRGAAIRIGEESNPSRLALDNLQPPRYLDELGIIAVRGKQKHD